MTRTEFIIQLLKVAIALAFGAYFVWWSLQVLDRLTPEYGSPTAVAARASWRVTIASVGEPFMEQKALGPETPPMLLARADEVIE
jgi:hypothetical protein